MNPIAEEILMHYGMPRRSGRYPWGSGENPYQHSGDFLSRIDELKSQGMSDTEIAKAMGLTTTQYRTQKSLAKDERRALDVARAKSLREDGLSLNEIAKEMGFANDSSVRSLLNENSEVRMNQAKTTAEFIKKQIDEKGISLMWRELKNLPPRETIFWQKDLVYRWKVIPIILHMKKHFFIKREVIGRFGLGGVKAVAVITLQAVIAVSVDMLPLPGGMGISEKLFAMIFIPVFGKRLLLPGMILSRGIGYYTELGLSALLTIVANFTIGRKREIEC